MVGERSDEAADKRHRALQLRKAGVTYDQIAQQVGYANRGTAHKAVAQALRDSQQETTPESHRLDSQRLDQVLMALWAKAMSGDVKAVDRVLRVIELRTGAPPVERRGAVEAATKRDLECLPETVQRSGLAASALELARNVDLGVSPAGCVKELRVVMARLSDQLAPDAGKGSGGIADLTARIARRRSSSA